MLRRQLFLLFSLLVAFRSDMQAQLKLYEATFNGGVVTGGYSNGATIPSGSGSFNVNIPSGSTIRQAYLIAGRVGNAPDVTVTLNGTPFTFNGSNIFTTGFNTIYGGLSGVHVIDVTASISPATSAYTIAVPNQNTVSDKFPEFYLYIAFDNGSMPAITSAIYCNTNNMDVSLQPWTLTTTTPILTANPVGLAILGGYATTGSDCENVDVNGTALGAFAGQDFNASSIWGVMAGFQFYNNVLTGYNDDNANQAIAGTDALSNIQALIPNNTTSIPVTFTHCGGAVDNHVWALFLTSTGTVLDSKLLGFDAKLEGPTVALNWEMESEDGIASYVLERSPDGNSFESLHQQRRDGGSAGKRYQWMDAKPLPGEAWYRLRMVGEDGLARFSDIRTVNRMTNGFSAQINPNPVQAGDLLHVTFGKSLDADWELYHLGDARLMRRGHVSDAAAWALPTEGLAAGPYALRVHGHTGSQIIRFVIE
jgi:hypothetical protein